MKSIRLIPPRRTLPPTPLQDALFAATVAVLVVALALGSVVAHALISRGL